MNPKKRIAGVVAMIYLAGMTAACSTAADPAKTANAANNANAVVSNDFEVNYDGWCTSTNSMSLVAQEGMGYNNSRGMVVTDRKRATDNVWSVKGMYLSDGVDYSYSAMVYSDTAETFHFSLTCADASGKESSVPLADVTAEAGKWTKLTADYTATEGSRTFKLSINTDSESDFRFDDVTVTSKSKIEKKAVPKGLKDEFAGYFRVGNILNGGTVKNPDILAGVLQNYNSITCENETKPDSTLVQSKCKDDNIAVSLNNAAAIFDFCAQNGIGVRGHTLVWHSQTPTWFFKEGFKPSGEWVTPEVMDKRMESYIKNMFEAIATQYPTLDLYAYDVVNEAISDDSNRNIIYGGAREPGDNNTSGGKSAWVQVYGDNSFIEKAFVYARKYAPEGCKLFYNDYNEYWGHKRDKIYDMCKNLYEKGLLDGVGMQSHVNGDIGGFSGADAHLTAMKKYLSIGCEVQVTELDINCENGKFTDEQAAQKYEAIFKAAMDCNNDPLYTGKVTAVCIWGPNDANTWIQADNRPLLFDTANQPKPAYTALTKMIPESEWGDGSKPFKADIPKKEINTAKTDGDNVTAVKIAEKSEPESSATNNNSGSANAEGGSYDDDFEKDSGGWVIRGSGEATLSDKAADGNGSLFVQGRTAAWNGAAKSLDPNEFAPGSVCSFSVKVMFEDGGDTDTFYTKLQYNDGSGSTQYASVAEGTAEKGKWITLSNDEYTIPSDASDMQIYVETAGSTNDFYIDSASGKVAVMGEVPEQIEVAPLNFGEEWKNNADISWIDTEKPMVAIAFDDGPVGTGDKASSIRIQDAISQNGGHATFFYWGNRINASNEAEITRAQELGFEIANHTYSHTNLTTLSADKIQSDIGKSAEILTDLTGQEEFLLRPPYLGVNDSVMKNSGAPLITCAVDTKDWDNASVRDIIDVIVSKAENGSLDNTVVLMHETLDNTAEAMEYIAPYLKENGWQIVTVSELFKANEQAMYNGTVYTKAN